MNICKRNSLQIPVSDSGMLLKGRCKTIFRCLYRVDHPFSFRPLGPFFPLKTREALLVEAMHLISLALVEHKFIKVSPSALADMLILKHRVNYFCSYVWIVIILEQRKSVTRKKHLIMTERVFCRSRFHKVVALDL